MSTYTILVDLDGYGDPQPVDARTLDRDTLVSLRYEADMEALVIIDEVLAVTP